MPKLEVIRALTGHASALDETCVRLAASYQPLRPPTVHLSIWIGAPARRSIPA